MRSVFINFTKDKLTSEQVKAIDEGVQICEREQVFSSEILEALEQEWLEPQQAIEIAEDAEREIWDFLTEDRNKVVYFHLPFEAKSEIFQAAWYEILYSEMGFYHWIGERTIRLLFSRWRIADGRKVFDQFVELEPSFCANYWSKDGC